MLHNDAVDSTASLCSILEILRNSAVASSVRRGGGMQIARSRAPRAPENKRARVECVSVRCASRCGGG
eukprot:11165836-Lingulodinium_polyedra.AAC.1